MAYGLGVARGMLTTISHLVKPPVTIQYPEERLDMPIWTRGRPRLLYEVVTGDLRSLRLLHCTLVPGRAVLPGSAPDDSYDTERAAAVLPLMLRWLGLAEAQA